MILDGFNDLITLLLTPGAFHNKTPLTEPWNLEGLRAQEGLTGAASGLPSNADSQAALVGNLGCSSFHHQLYPDTSCSSPPRPSGFLL